MAKVRWFKESFLQVIQIIEPPLKQIKGEGLCALMHEKHRTSLPDMAGPNQEGQVAVVICAGSCTLRAPRHTTGSSDFYRDGVRKGAAGATEACLEITCPARAWPKLKPSSDLSLQVSKNKMENPQKLSYSCKLQNSARLQRALWA